jgi:predicted glycoside hydrolase/deacetylase ChbG (UPF0249 family)
MIGKENIDHLDCHHFIFRNPIIKKAMIEIAKENNWYLRTTDEFREEALQHSVKTNDYFCESFYDETATSDTMLSYFKTVKDDSLVEVMTHCGLIDEDTRNRTKYTNREHEIKQLIVLKELGFYKKYNFIKCKNLTK